MSMLFPKQCLTPDDAPSNFRALFEQRKWWKTADSGWVRIKDMTPNHRANAATLLLRQAPMLADRMGWADAMWLDINAACMSENALDGIEAEIFMADARRLADPMKWMKATPLYRSLTKKRKRDSRGVQQ